MSMAARSASLFLVLAFSGVLAFSNDAYQYVYEYPDNSVRMLMPKTSCVQGCETTVQITYNAAAPLNEAAAASSFGGFLSGLGITALLYNAPAPSPAPPSHHTVHTAHSPHNVMPPATPHNPSAHSMAMDVPMGMGAGGGTVIAPMPAPAPGMGMAMDAPHAPTIAMPMGMPAMKSVTKASFVLSFLVSSSEACGDVPNYDSFANNPEIIAVLSTTLGATVTNIAFTEPSCTGCAEFLGMIAEICPPNDPPAEVCQNVQTAQLCSEPVSTETGVDSSSAKVDCAWDLSTSAGLDEFFTANC